MNNKKQTFQDIDALSAYLDDQLRPKEKERLKARLAQEADLQQQLKELKITRAVLRSAPKVQRPRSFTLTPEMVNQQRFVWQAMRFSRMVAVAATVLFAFVFAGQVFLRGSSGLVAMAPESNSVAYDQAVEGDDIAAMPEAMGGGGEIDEDAPMALQVPEEEMEEAAAEESVEEESLDMMDTVLAETQTPEGTMPPADEDAAAAGLAEDDEAEEAEATEPAGIIVMPEPTETVEAREMESSKTVEDDGALEPDADLLTPPMPPEDGRGAGPPEENGVQAQPGVSDIVWVQGGLLTLAVLSGALYIYFRRRLK